MIRLEVTPVASIARRPDGVWRARYRDPSGKEHARHFARKVDAQRWLDETTASIVTGQYVGPNDGKVTFKEYAEAWRAAQVHRPSSTAHIETTLRRHAYPLLGDRPLASIRPTEIQAWVKRLSLTLAPATVGVAHGVVASIFKAAVRDRKIRGSPCEGIRLPKQEPRKVVPLPTEAVQALADAVPGRYRALVVLAAGTGLRQGEVFGLTLDRVDFPVRTVTVDRQMVTLPGREPFHGPPKTAASYRTVPLPRVVLDALDEHLVAFPVGSSELVFTTPKGEALRRTAFSANVWRPAAASVGCTGVTFHQLRHYYASLLIRHGESPKVVQVRLGHATAAETLDTYSQLWPDSEDRTREAVDAILGVPADSSRTETPP